MPIMPPALDDRRFDDLVEELLARIPAHTPEWTNPRPGDPGRTLIELFAWLGEALLYRANLVPERQRLAFLRLLGVPMRAALPARGLVSVALGDESAVVPISLRPLAAIAKPLPFETLGELTVLPLSAECYYKRDLSDDQKRQMDAVVTSLQQVYNLPQRPRPYITTPVFAGGAPEAGGFDMARVAIDKCLWLALLAPKPELRDAALAALGANPSGGRQQLNVGVMPALAVPALSEEVGRAAQLPHVWEISTVTEGLYLSCDRVADTSQGLTRRGVLRLALPGLKDSGDPARIGAPATTCAAPFLRAWATARRASMTRRRPPAGGLAAAAPHRPAEQLLAELGRHQRRRGRPAPNAGGARGGRERRLARPRSSNCPAWLLSRKRCASRWRKAGAATWPGASRTSC